MMVYDAAEAERLWSRMTELGFEIMDLEEQIAALDEGQQSEREALNARLDDLKRRMARFYER